MRLDHATWQEVETYLQTNRGVVLPMGSTEQHGPMGVIGTDAICAEEIARRVGQEIGVYVAPTLAYSPAPFNMGFGGTMSISATVFEELVRQLLVGLYGQGFERIYILNGHGANLEPTREAAKAVPNEVVLLRSWWDFEGVNRLRKAHFGDWEGMHATPAEISITQVTTRVIDNGDAKEPPQKLSAQYIAAHAGDKHGPANAHRETFPDGRVGSHSALATAEVGQKLLQSAVSEICDDLNRFKI